MKSPVWIVGRGGLLGSSVSRACVRIGVREFVPETRFSWNDESSLASDLRCALGQYATQVESEAQWCIIWAAGTGTMASSEGEFAKETNILRMLLRCIDADATLRTKRGTIVFASSAGAVYAGSTDEIITEKSDPHPLNAYGRGKLEQEDILSTFVRAHPTVSLLIARISNVYGAGQSRSKKQGLISHIARCILRRQPINIFVPFDTIRDYITADDAADMLLNVMEIQESGAQAVTKIIASETPTTIAQIIGSFKHLTRVAPRVITSTSSLRSAYTHRVCFRSIVEPTGTQPKTSLTVGIADVMAAERSALTHG